MHILVTGGLGFIGSHLCTRLLRDGHDVTSCDNTSSPDALAHGYAMRDLPRFADWGYALEDLPAHPERFEGVDVVIHLAAKAGVRASLADPGGYARTNVEGTLHVLEACRAVGVSTVIVASSSSVYGHPVNPGQPSREDHPLPPPPLSPYAATKQAMELLCQTYAHLYDMDILALRLFSVYGPRMRPDLALPIFARQILAGQPVTLFGDGTSLRDYTYIDDSVEGVCAALRWLGTGTGAGRYTCLNLGSGRPIALRQMVRILGTVLDAPVTLQYSDAHPADATQTWADIAQAKTLLGYAPRVLFAEGVQRFASWVTGTHA